jgi:hypothetical protein
LGRSPQGCLQRCRPQSLINARSTAHKNNSKYPLTLSRFGTSLLNVSHTQHTHMNYQVTLTFDELVQARAGLQCYIAHLWRVRRASADIISANCWNSSIRGKITALRALRKSTLV